MSDEDGGRGVKGPDAGGPRLLPGVTDDLVDRQRRILDGHEDRFDAAKELVRSLGAHWCADERTGDAEGSYAEVGFWTPELSAEVPADAVELEVLTAREPVDLGTETTVAFDRATVETRREGEFTWAAVEGMRPGTRQGLGSLYRLVYEHDGERGEVLDPLAMSLPFGAYAPAELYDLDRLDRERPDRGHFESLGTEEETVATSEDDGLPGWRRRRRCSRCTRGPPRKRGVSGRSPADSAGSPRGNATERSSRLRTATSSATTRFS